MSIAKFRRISLHPWVWWIVVKRALTAFTEGERTIEQRRRLLGIEKAIDAVLDPTDHRVAVIENPYLRLHASEIERRQKHNDAILKADPDDGYWAVDEVVDGRVVPMGYHPIPKPDLRCVVDVADGDAKVLENVVEAYAKSGKVDNSVNEAMIAAWDAIHGAAMVEVDTAAAEPAAKAP